MGVEEITNATDMQSLIIGLDPTGFLFAAILYGVMIIFIIGWSYQKGIESGLLVGGFFTTLAGFGMLLYNLVPMSVLIIPITLFAVGALMMGFAAAKD